MRFGGVLPLALLLAATASRAHGYYGCNTAPQAANDPEGLSYGPTCSEYVAQYPDAVEELPEPDYRIVCPAVTMAHRIGAMPGIDTGDTYDITVGTAIAAAVAMGCGDICARASRYIAAVQLDKPFADVVDTDMLDIRYLRPWPLTATNCGFTFSIESHAGNEGVVFDTLARFAQHADGQGRLTYGDIVEVKRELCKRDYDLGMALNSTFINEVDEENETLKLHAYDLQQTRSTFAWLGGVDGGTVDFVDMVRFLTARLPAKKSKFVLEDAILAYVENNFDIPPAV